MATHPRLEYLLVAAVAAAGCYLATPIARAVAVRWKAIAYPRDRDVHAVAIPRLGGLALLIGFGLALFTARQLPTLRDAFGNGGPEMLWIVASGALLCLIGALDDRYELDSLTKLAGQVLAAGMMTTLGRVQLAFFYVPWGDNGTVVLGQDLSIPITILLTVFTINAINFIDGLDGLAAGVCAIGALSFFAYSYHLGLGTQLSIAAPPTLLSAALAGTCIGFLPHNFFPARIFMGDSGSMLIGLMLSAAATTATTNADPTAFPAAASLVLILPLLIVLAVLAIPFVDLMLAVVRRLSHGQSPFAPDKQHLHHRLLELGHSHRRAVLLLYYWSALLGFSGAAPAIWPANEAVVVVIICGAVVGVLLLAVPPLVRLSRRPRRSSSRSSAVAPASTPAESPSAPVSRPDPVPVPSSLSAIDPLPARPAGTPLNGSPNGSPNGVSAPSTTPGRRPEGDLSRP